MDVGGGPFGLAYGERTAVIAFVVAWTDRGPRIRLLLKRSAASFSVDDLTHSTPRLSFHGIHGRQQAIDWNPSRSNACQKEHILYTGTCYAGQMINYA